MNKRSLFIPRVCVGIVAITLYTFIADESYWINFNMGSGKSHVDILTADVKQLERLLCQGKVTSSHLVKLYLGQIEKHDGYLHAMIQITPREILLKRAHELDAERKAGRKRTRPAAWSARARRLWTWLVFQGFSFILLYLFDYISSPSLSKKLWLMDDQLLRNGAIILGKSNLSEFANWRGIMLPSGWSAVGGQTQSAYVLGGVQYNDGKDGHSVRSSSGSAVAVSAGYSPVSIGTETDGSLICPAGRAALYTIKPSIGLVPQDGIVPASLLFDTAGPMTKSVYDLAILLDAISDPAESFTSSITRLWSDISVGVLDPTLWKFPDTFIKPIPEADEQILHDITGAYATIKAKAKNFVDNVPLNTIDSLGFHGNNSEITVLKTDMKKLLNQYLEDLPESKVRSLQDVIDFNKKHAEQELPPHHANQDFFLQTQDQELSSEEYKNTLQHLRHVTRDQGIHKILQEYDLDVIIGPADSFITSLAAGSGYPVAGMPLSYLKFNGRPLGFAALAGKKQDALLVKVMSAWEATFPTRKPPQLA
ncbi:uncharacterized protein JN550_005698 [Neoarthrinium moseri]|uniref:uncharacterized protein n=1 Tax=Neoarthrinium moseri TaxID=1658444 RepID=UPI001FDDEA61|nr:uncharacterized protein JN550_005698 [Neoarthrinium moseri]KAI1869717.1 hypothetical protein JN550_005698 [Neoarthrinium moseri]